MVHATRAVLSEKPASALEAKCRLERPFLQTLLTLLSSSLYHRLRDTFWEPSSEPSRKQSPEPSKNPS